MTQEEIIVIEELEYAPDIQFNYNVKPKTNIKCIYGVFIGERLVYIGYTWSGFENRVEKHKEAIENKEIGDKISKEMYEALRNCNGEYSFKILYKCPNEMNEYGLQVVEKALIGILSPKYNKEGVTKQYQFRERGRVIGK